jgi:hypothetical protein
MWVILICSWKKLSNICEIYLLWYRSSNHIRAIHMYMQDMFFLLKIVLAATTEWNTWKGCKKYMDYYIKENSPIITKFVRTVLRFYLLEVKHTHTPFSTKYIYIYKIKNKKWDTVTPCLCSMSNQFINAWFLSSTN